MNIHEVWLAKISFHSDKGLVKISLFLADIQMVLVKIRLLFVNI